MVEWAAANLESESPIKSGDADADAARLGTFFGTEGIGAGVRGQPQSLPSPSSANHPSTSTSTQQHKRRRRVSETPEAALARLTSSYSAAMGEVGALHKASNSLVRDLMGKVKVGDIDGEGRGNEDGEKKPKPVSPEVKGSDTPSGGYEGDVEDSNMDIDNADETKIDNDYDDNKEDDSSMTMNAKIQSIKEIAKSARNAFEKTVLSDPLIQPHVSTFANVLKSVPTFEQSSDDAQNQAENVSTLTSAAHQSSLRELAYASLLNYADLLICSCGYERKCGDESILDRGIVSPLKIVEYMHNTATTASEGESSPFEPLCLWSDIEEDERTKRLVLVAYCDAADLDGSDPTIWLKLACAARGLGKVLLKKRQIDEAGVTAGDKEDENIPMEIDVESSDHSNGYVNLSYERLERYALERGMTALKAGLPPNRAVISAFREFERNWNSISTYNSLPAPTPTADLIIDLPRYRWSTLGRLLLRACREGVVSNNHDGWTIRKSWKTSSHKYKGVDFASPAIHVKISPLLTLPQKVLVGVCEYLGTDARRLEATCRSVSVEIISARALIEKDRNARMKQMEQEMGDMLKENEMKDPVQDSKSDIAKQQLMRFAHRSSKRVRSQLITSGKQAERNAKRNSIEYCLISSILPCTMEHPDYNKCLTKSFNWDNLLPLNACSQKAKKLAEMLKKEEDKNFESDNRMAAEKKMAQRQVVDISQAGNTSLTSFIKRWSVANSGARDMLHRFLAHISCYVDIVYECEKGNDMMMSQCISDCFDVLQSGNSTHNSINPSWYGQDIYTPGETNHYTAIEVLAMNLLSTELKMRTCERHGMKVASFDDNVQAVRTNIPHLLQYSEALMHGDFDTALMRLVAALQTRTYWLAGIFYVWWSRNTAAIGEVKSMETFALQFIDKAIESLCLPASKPISCVSTPHLESPGRVGDHWIELSVHSLTAYRDQIESSTVTSRVKQKFCNIILDLQKRGEVEIADWPKDIQSQFDSIEKDLSEHYQQNFDELINDFVNMYRSNLVKKPQQDMFGEIDGKVSSPSERWGALWKAIPSNASTPIPLTDITAPSLLTMLVLCHRSKKVKFASNMCVMLTGLIVCVVEKWTKLVERKDSSSDYFAIADDDDSSSDESSTDGDSDTFDPTILMTMACFLTEKLDNIITTCDQDEFANCQSDIMSVLKLTIESSSGFASRLGEDSTTNQFLRLQPNLDLLSSSLTATLTVLNRLNKSSSMYNDVLATVFAALVRVVIHSKKIMVLLLGSRDKNRLGRSECHGLVLLRTRFAAAVATELASILSNYGNNYGTDGKVEESFLIKNIIELCSPTDSIDKDISPLVRLAESLSWFWDFSYSAESIEASTASRYAAITNTIHKHSATSLVVPIAGAISALCGSVGHGPNSLASRTFSRVETERRTCSDDAFSLSDYFDSDESTRRWTPEEDVNEEKTLGRKRLLQTLSRSIQCIGLVFSNHNDNDLSLRPPSILFPFKEGFFLPLIVVRVLSNISDYVMTEFSERKEKRPRAMAIWDETYPFGFRGAGAQLDLLLHRAYRCLHGINISSPHLATQVAKDAVYPTSFTGIPGNELYFLPESTMAAIRIYRCAKRAYSNGRRSIPQDILDCISTSLPKAKESENIDGIKRFIFGMRKEGLFNTAEEITTDLSSSSDNIDVIPDNFPAWLLEDVKGWKDYQELSASQSEFSSLEMDIRIVQRGICEFLADGPIPRIGSSSETSDNYYTATNGNFLERKIAADTETAVHKKLSSIISALHYNPADEKMWYRAGLCIGVKLNIILDRLPNSLASYGHFYLPTFSGVKEREVQWKRERGYPRDANKLLKDQRRAYRGISSRRCGVLGPDMSIYMEHNFCDAESLKALDTKMLNIFDSCDMEKCVEEKDRAVNTERSYLASINANFEKSCYSKWQLQWGANFVSSLRLMRHRCFLMAMHLSRKNEKITKSDNIYTEVAEALGTSYYDSIGFSAREQTKFEKRQKAKRAKAYFQSALESLRSSVDGDGVPATWELLFMIGKCDEKIANTLKEENFSETGSIRQYEKIMSQAMESYDLSIVEAKAFTDEGNSLEFRGGGSSHGLVELVYRLHASRLKVLLTAVKCVSDEREASIDEALRITTEHWYETAQDDFKDKPLYDKLWIVLCDVVEALAFCRREQPYFHRSVYRHAQALLWAPLFNDPEGALNGSFESIPAHKSCRVRGLDSGSCVASAQPIISALFDKKRPQIVAVWVTTPSSPTPFEAINNSSRKFDRLRCKYIRAFIECMYLCKRKDHLESLMKWTNTASRDLPSFYDFSLKWSLKRGSAPIEASMKDNLLISMPGLIYFTKRTANVAICRILLEDLAPIKFQDCTGDEKKVSLDKFIDIYNCFLRLNCPIKSSLWQSQKMRSDLSSGFVPEADALCDAFQRIFSEIDDVVKVNEMSFEEKIFTLQAAVKKGQKLSFAMETDLAQPDADRKARKKKRKFQIAEMSKTMELSKKS